MFKTHKLSLLLYSSSYSHPPLLLSFLPPTLFLFFIPPPSFDHLLLPLPSFFLFFLTPPYFFSSFFPPPSFGHLLLPPASFNIPLSPSIVYISTLKTVHWGRPGGGLIFHSLIFCTEKGMWGGGGRAISVLLKKVRIVCVFGFI